MFTPNSAPPVTSEINTPCNRLYIRLSPSKNLSSTPKTKKALTIHIIIVAFGSS